MTSKTNRSTNEHVLLINKYPYWLYNAPHYFLRGIEGLCILHSNETSLDFPSRHYRSAVVCDFSDSEQVSDAVAFLNKNYGFTRVVNLTEQNLEMAAQIREEYNIPGMKPHTAVQFRNKLEMKKIVQSAGLLVPISAKISNIENILNFYNEHGKSIIKPVDGMGTYKTFVLDHVEQAEIIVREIEDLSKFEIEQFISGQMFHCDSVVVDGEVKLCSVSRFLNSTLDFSKDGYLATVMIDDGPLKDRIVEFNQKVIEAFDLLNGVTHHEFFLCHDQFVFCEIGARAGGAGVIPSIMYTYGVNLFEADLNLQIQRELHFPLLEKRQAGWLVIHRIDGVVTEISSTEDFDFDWIYYKGIHAKRGDILTKAEHSVASVADFTITGTSEQDVVQKIEMIRDAFKLHTHVTKGT